MRSSEFPEVQLYARRVALMLILKTAERTKLSTYPHSAQILEAAVQAAQAALNEFDATYPHIAQASRSSAT